MSHAEKCPVCGGSGIVHPDYPVITKDGLISTAGITCKGCGGLGWVTVQDTPMTWETPKTTG
mgnify:CR=1 FL=1